MSFEGLAFDDPRWESLTGSYRVPYDPRDALFTLEHSVDREDAWSELWNELHHQGDVGVASYVTVPHLVRIHEARGIPDWNTYALVVAIEEARLNGNNPPVPEDLKRAYDAALRRLMELGLAELKLATDGEHVASIVAAIALGKGLPNLARMAMLSEDELQEILDEAGWG